jgi:hypothetical protein
LFVRDGHDVLWTATGLTSPTPASLTAIDNVMEDILLRFASLFVKPTGLPPVYPCSHRILLLLGTLPVAVRLYWYAPEQKAELESQCRELLRQGVIRPSSSTFSTPVILVKKGDSSWLMCVDYRVLNSKTVMDKYPILVVEELLDELRGAVFFNKLDLHSGYHQVQMHNNDVEKMAFHTHEGQFEFLVMPFGLTNAPAMF